MKQKDIDTHLFSALRNTLVWVLGLNFALRAGQEHRNLRMKNSQLSVAIDEDGKQYLEYKEDVRLQDYHFPNSHEAKMTKLLKTCR